MGGSLPGARLGRRRQRGDPGPRQRTREALRPLGGRSLAALGSPRGGGRPWRPCVLLGVPGGVLVGARGFGRPPPEIPLRPLGREEGGRRLRHGCACRPRRRRGLRGSSVRDGWQAADFRRLPLADVRAGPLSQHRGLAPALGCMPPSTAHLEALGAREAVLGRGRGHGGGAPRECGVEGLVQQGADHRARGADPAQADACCAFLGVLVGGTRLEDTCAVEGLGPGGASVHRRRRVGGAEPRRGCGAGRTERRRARRALLAGRAESCGC
mmetsp:Transcript_25767/g.74132  ORF Transcript_25767/g.74132 Transcript_25767/m.74132 type:complete len:269 (-) Transcript_25767:493-1299(-)